MDNTLFLPELKEMLAENDAKQLREFCTALHPASTAEFMQGLSAEETWTVLSHADEQTREEIFSYLEPSLQVEIAENVDREEISRLITGLASDDRVDLLKNINPDIVAQLLPLVPIDVRRDILRLTAYQEGTAGALMTTQYAKVVADAHVGEALQEITKQSEELETIYYIYIVDQENHLQGVVSARQLVSYMGKPTTPIADIMERGIVTAQVQDDQEIVADLVARYNLLALPIVNEERILLGIVTHDDAMDVFREEAVKDAQQIAAVAPLDTSYLQTNLATITWKRGIWLTVLFFASALTIVILRKYHHTLESIDWLVLFLPLIVSTGGNSGSQSATLIITALNSGDLKISDWMTVFQREMATGLILGGFLGMAGYGLAIIVHPSHSPYDSLVVPITILLVVISGMVTGSFLPLIFRRLGLDPALMSNPCVAGIIDILGIIIYLSVGMLLLGNSMDGVP